MRIVITLISLFLLVVTINAQHVGINETKPEYELQVKPVNDNVSASFFISNRLESSYLHLEGGSTTGPRLWWAPEDYFSLATANSGGGGYSEFLRLDGKTLGIYNTGRSVFVGEEAGESDDELNRYNTGIGYFSLNQNISGVSNVAVGASTLRHNVGGYDNVAMGRNASLYNTTGYFNVAIGHSALLNNLTGERNTVLGTLAGLGSTGSSFSGNVLLGYQAGRYVTESERLYIDNTPTSTPLIYGEFDNDLVRLNGNAEVTGNLKLGKSDDAPTAGDIRYNAEKHDFEGYTGDEWLSLTKGNQQEWGHVSGLPSEKHAALPSDGQDDDRFGYSVDIDGDYAIVGAPGAEKAYVFHFVDNCWVEEAILTDPDGELEDEFGYSVAIYGDYAMVGAPYSDYDNGVNSGRVLFFERNGTSWTLKSTEEPDLPRSNDNFGYSCSMDGDYAVIGVPGDHFTVSNQGSIYIMYNFNGDWSSPTSKYIVAHDATPPAGDGLGPDAFGTSVDISGDKVIVGAPGHDTTDPSTMEWIEDNGAFYLYVRGANWTEWDTLPNSIVLEYSSRYIGNKVAIDNDRIAFSFYNSINDDNRFKILDGSGPNGWFITGINNFGKITNNFSNLYMDNTYLMKGNILYEKIDDFWYVIEELTTTDNKGSVTAYTPDNYCIAISGDKIVLGNSDYRYGPNSGKVYFYHK